MDGYKKPFFLDCLTEKNILIRHVSGFLNFRKPSFFLFFVFFFNVDGLLGIELLSKKEGGEEICFSSSFFIYIYTLTMVQSNECFL